MPRYEVDTSTVVHHTMIVDARDKADARRKARGAEYVESWETQRGPIKVSFCRQSNDDSK